MCQPFGVNFLQVTFRLRGRKPGLCLQLPQRISSIQAIFGRNGNRLEQNRACTIVNGDFLTTGGTMQQFTQIPAGFLHGHCFHGKILQAIGLKSKWRR